MALTFIPEYNRAIDVTGDAAVTFVGASMLLAAARGYAGCEVLAISNWLLRRDDQAAWCSPRSTSPNRNGGVRHDEHHNGPPR